MNINEKIKLRREQLGLTLQEVGDYIGVGKATIQKYESGDIKNLKHGTIEKLSEVLKVSPGYLMGWVDDLGNPTIEYIKKKSFVTELLETMINNEMIKSVDDIDDNMIKLIVDAVKIEADKLIKDKN